MSLFFFLVGHMHGNLLAMSLFFCSLGHNRAKIFYMSPGSPCLLPFFVCHGFLPADMRLVALFAHEDFCNLTLCCF